MSNREIPETMSMRANKLLAKISEFQSGTRSEIELLVNFIRSQEFLDKSHEQQQKYGALIRRALKDTQHRVECPNCSQPAMLRVEKTGVVILQHSDNTIHSLKKEHLIEPLKVVSAPLDKRELRI